MAYFPIFQDLEDQPVLIVGGGAVALRKAEKLLPYGPRLTVIAPRMTPELEALPVTRQYRTFSDSDLGGNWMLVIAATNDRTVNRRVSELSAQNGIPVNVVDDPELCTFLFPSLVKKGSLSVGISTGGSSPSAAVWLRTALESQIPEHFEELLDLLQSQRQNVKASGIPERQRGQCLKAMLDLGISQAQCPTRAQCAAIIEKAVSDYEQYNK